MVPECYPTHAPNPPQGWSSCPPSPPRQWSQLWVTGPHTPFPASNPQSSSNHGDTWGREGVSCSGFRALFWEELCPFTCKAPTPRTQSVTEFGHRVFNEVIQLNEATGLGPSPPPWHLVRVIKTRVRTA